VAALRNAFTVDAVVTVVDAPAVAAGDFADDPVAVDAQRRADDNLDHDSPLHELFEDQLATADLVIVHKTDGSTPRRWPAWKPPSAPRPRPA
jgi:cobalamin biosynthesis protein CobW